MQERSPYRGPAMRTTIDIDDKLLQRAARVMGTTDPEALVREALKALLEREDAQRLARLGGGQPGPEAPRRRRTAAPH